MDELDILKRRLDEAVTESAIKFGSGGSSSDPRVAELYAEYQAQKIVSDLLLSSEVDIRLSQLCARYASDERNNIPLLPKINAFSVSEMHSDIGELVKAEYTPESFALNVNVSPLNEESDVWNKFEMKDGDDIVVIVEYLVRVLNTTKYSVSYKITYLREIYTGTRNLHESEELKICVKLLQFNNPNIEFTFLEKDTLDTSFDTHLVTNLGGDIPVDCLLTIDILQMIIPTGTTYVKPRIDTTRIAENYVSGFAGKLISFGAYDVSSSESSDLSVISVNTVDYVTIIDDNAYDYRMKDKEFLNKIIAEYLLRAMRNQSAYYYSNANETIEYAGDVSTSSIQTVLVDTAQTLVTILDILQKVSKWDEVKRSIDFFSAVSTVATAVNVGIDNITDNVRMTPGMIRELVSFSASAGSKDWCQMESSAIDIKAKDVEMESNLAVVFSDENVVVAVKYTIKAIHGAWKTQKAHGNDRVFKIISYYDVGTSPRQVGCELSTTSDFSVPIKYQVVDYELRITSVAVLDRLATARIADVSGTLSLNALFMTKEVTFATANLQGMEVTLNEFGTMYGYGANVDIVLTDSLPTSVYMPLIKGGLIKDQLNSTTAWKNTSGTWSFVVKEKTSSFNGDSDDAYSRAEFTTNFGQHGGPLVISSNQTLLKSKLSAKDVNYAKFSNGKTLYETFNPDGTEADPFQFALSTIGLAVKSDASYTAQQAPLSLADSVYLNQYNTTQDKINWQLSKDISDIRDNVAQLEDKLERLAQQIAILQKQINPPLYMMFVNELIGALTAQLITAVTTNVLMKMSELIGPLRRVASEIYSVSANAMSAMRPKRRGFYSVDQAAMMATFIDDVATAAGKKSELRLKMQTPRPAFKSGIHDLQYFDMSEKIDVLTSYYMRGRINQAINMDLVRPEFNKLADGIPMPEFKVFYKPLDGLGKLGQPVHKIWTKRDSTRKFLMDNARQKSHRLPSHSFCTYEDYHALPSGKVRKELVFMGIGEFSGGGAEIGGGVGGLIVKYESDAVDKVTGVRVFKPLSFEECGYTANEVSNIYLRLYKPKLTELQGITAEKQWASLVADADRKVQSSDVMYKTYVPDSGVGESYKSLVRNPPEFQYNLLYNNCQSFTNSLINFQTRGIIDPSWPSTLITAMMTPRVQFINSMLTSTEAKLSRITRDVLSAITDVSDFATDYPLYDRYDCDGITTVSNYKNTSAVKYTLNIR